MHLPGNEASDRRLRVSLMEQIDAEAQAISTQGGGASTGSGNRQIRPITDSAHAGSHRRICDVQLYCHRLNPDNRIAVFHTYAGLVLALPGNAFERDRLRGNRRGLSAQIDFSYVYPTSGLIDNPNYSFQAGKIQYRRRFACFLSIRTFHCPVL